MIRSVPNGLAIAALLISGCGLEIQELNRFGRSSQSDSSKGDPQPTPSPTPSSTPSGGIEHPDYPNLPAGASVLYENHFDTQGFVSTTPVRLSSNAEIGSWAYSPRWDYGDVEALPQESLIRWHYRPGMAGGGSPGRAALESMPHSWRTYYILLRVRWNHWQPHGSGVNKILYIDMEGANQPGSHFINRRHDAIDSVLQYAQGYTPFTDSQRRLPWPGWNPSSNHENRTTIEDGRWYTIEWVMSANTVLTHPADGTMEIYVDGVRQFRFTDIRFDTVLPARFVNLRLDPVWGGVGGSVNMPGMSLDFDRFVIGGGL